MTTETRLAQIEMKLDLVLALLQGGAMASEQAACAYTLHAWLDEWLRAYKVPNIKRGTFNMIDIAVRVHIKPNLPDVPLNLVTGLELQKFLTGINMGRTRKSVFNVLKESFAAAHNLKLITDNPTQAVKIPVHIHEQGMALTPDEIVAFLTAIRGHTLENYFLFLLYTGCRRSEALTLYRNDVDFENKLLHIHGTKTKGSKRTIPLFENVAALLSGIEKKADGSYFSFAPDYPTHKFKKLCPTHRLHDLRHTFATTCLKAKIPMKVVQKWLGHSKLSTTADTYSHVTDEINRAEAAALDLYLTQKSSE